MLHRLVWGLVHSSNQKDVDRGLRFADELLRDKSLDAQDQRDLVYLTAVAMYKLGKVCSNVAEFRLQALLDHDAFPNTWPTWLRSIMADRQTDGPLSTARVRLAILHVAHVYRDQLM